MAHVEGGQNEHEPASSRRGSMIPTFTDSFERVTRNTHIEASQCHLWRHVAAAGHHPSTDAATNEQDWLFSLNWKFFRKCVVAPHLIHTDPYLILKSKKLSQLGQRTQYHSFITCNSSRRSQSPRSRNWSHWPEVAMNFSPFMPKRRYCGRSSSSEPRCTHMKLVALC